MDKKTMLHIINYLRRGTLTWHVRREVLIRSRKRVFSGDKFKNGKEKGKYHYQCAQCKAWFKDIGDLEVDHIVEIGPFTGNWQEYIGKMFCDISNLQALCIKCHGFKTSSNSRLRWQRKTGL
jgi:5-methylcytosine-specific restriction endonuclease McrA